MYYQTETLIIGSGVAGLTLAIKAAEFGSVLLVTKRNCTESNSKYAQGGIAAVLSPSDTVEAHIKDTLTTGNGLSDENAVRILAEGGREVIEDVVGWGTKFTRSADSDAWKQLDLGREGGHTAHRIVHAHDHTGQVMEEALIDQVRKLSEVTILEYHTLMDLITNHHIKDATKENHCYGAFLFDREKGEVVKALAKSTILATGGLGEVYEHTTNPEVATGDGVATAWRAGAAIANMEFVQFHPTTLFHPKANSFLISEALRGYGAILKDAEGVEFMDKYHPMKSLAPRDVVARAIDREMKNSGEPCVFLDIRHADAEETKEHFPKIYGKCLSFGIDITKDLIPVVPASHYSCGGVKVNELGETSIDALYCCGEASCTGVHGANRLASNSLLEAIVFAKKTALAVENHNREIVAINPLQVKEWDDSDTTLAEEWVLISHNRAEIQKVMWDYVGIVRNDERLQRALKRINLIDEEIELFYRKTRICTSILELRNLATVAKLIIHSALSRKESRGLHFTKDYPEKSDLFLKDTVLTKN